MHFSSIFLGEEVEVMEVGGQVVEVVDHRMVPQGLPTVEDPHLGMELQLL